MALCCLLKLLQTIGLIVLAVYSLVYFCPFGPCCKHLRSNLMKQCPDFVGPLTRNNHLDLSQRVLENEIGFGPASLAVHQGFFYAGVSDGRIVKFQDNKAQEILKSGPSNCVSIYSAKDKGPKCGYPMGLRFANENELIFADCVKGIFVFDLRTGKNHTLVPSSMRVDGIKLNYLQDLDVSSKTKGDFYFTDSSSSWSPTQPLWLNLITTQPDGRILHYSAATKHVKTVLDHLYFPSGVQLSPEEDFILFSQALVPNIMKFYLKGPKQGQAEVLIDNLPGVVGNIRPSGRGTYWVPISFVRVPWQLSLWEKLDFCQLTKFVVYSTFEGLSWLFAFLKNLIPMPTINNIEISLQQLKTESIYQNSYGLILEITAKGEILRSLHSPKGIVTGINQIMEHEGHLYFGSMFNSYIGKLKLK